MKYWFIVFFSLVCKQYACAQDAKSILRQSKAKCMQIDNGYIEITKESKFLTSADTFRDGRNHLYFKKQVNDGLFGYLFYNKAFNKFMHLNSAVYTGEELVLYYAKDSTGTISAVEKWAEQLKLERGKYFFYGPVLNKSAFPLPEDSVFLNPANAVEFVGEEKIGDVDCYHVKLNVVREASIMGMSTQNITTFYHFWIDKEGFIPLQYSETTSLKLNGEMMDQYHLYKITKHSFNIDIPDSLFSVAVVPTYCQLKEYSQDRIPLLAKGTVAPDWKLPSANKQKIKLSDYSGKVLLLNFTYKSCYPCGMAIPALNRLYDSYKSKGFEIVAINPYDKSESSFFHYLEKAGIKYPTVFDNEKKISELYHVTGYPSMYLINKQGNIVLAQTGFGDTVEEKLEMAIKELL